MARDMTTAFTLEHGQVAVFVAVDHCSAECVGLHAALRGTRFEALEPVWQGVVERFGAVEKDAARGLSIRHDHGSQYMSYDLAQKTRRGLRVRVEAGLSGGGNSYGYRVVRRLLADGTPVTGEREIDLAEAAIVARIFTEYATGQAPRKIAARLNAEGIPGPRGAWSGSTINGSQQRRNGILNNELYLGRLVWNRQRFVKDPETGKRVSRANPEGEWITSEVPELRTKQDEGRARLV